MYAIGYDSDPDCTVAGPITAVHMQDLMFQVQNEEKIGPCIVPLHPVSVT